MSTEYVTLKNRTSKTLTGQFDGKQYSFPPGYEGQWPETQAQRFKEQNPLMGSEDYFDGYKQYLLGIVEHNDDISPIEQSPAIERWSRAGTTREVVTIRGRGYSHSQDKGAPAPDITAVRTESFEPQAGFDTETVAIVDAIDYKP